MAGTCSVWGALTRKRVFQPHQLEQGDLRRCLSVWDLTALGVGSTLGVGVYVIVGSVALHLAGPSIVLSFLIAAVASLFAGLCYAELAARVPKAGSAYIYTYVTVGEAVAFFIGWNMVLEGLFGTASVARGLSMYVDSMVNKAMSEWLATVMPITVTHLSPYFDVFSFLIVLLLGVLLAVGVRESAMVNNGFTIINMFVILFIIIAGGFRAERSNWSIPSELVPDGLGAGGFFPYGVWGMLRGAAVCFYGFVGFEGICATGEEVRGPRRAIPIAILSVLAIVFVAYASVATVVTMMVPYYLQENVAAVANVFSQVGMEWARWVVSIGAVFGITASLFGAMFPLPRLLYAMSSDGLLFHCLAILSGRKTPVVATLLSAVVIATLAAILELNELVLMMCFGTLLSYTIVAACIILLRYRSNYVSIGGPGYLKQILGFGEKSPTAASSLIVDGALVLFTCTCVGAALVGRHAAAPTAGLAALNAAALLLLVVITLQPQTKEELAFKTPLVPVVPCLSIYVNVHLMILINVQTWIRVGIWIAIGIPIYMICVCCYKRKESGNLEDNLKALSHADKNGKPPVQIVVETPTPPGTTRRSNPEGQLHDDKPPEAIEKLVEENVIKTQPIMTEEIVIQQAYIEDNEEREAKIIDLLDQVLQAEEDSYGEVISLRDEPDDYILSTIHESVVQRKSLSELSDAGSDASMGNQVLSKYDVVAQVHREDLPKVNEEEEVNDNVELRNHDEMRGQEEAFNDSDSNSRTDESGYSDTIDRINESAEDVTQETSNIPVPPPLDENYFKSPTFKKSYTISARPTKLKAMDFEEENKPRESITSNNSNDDTPMVFGSDKQVSFMSKLENIFQSKMSNNNVDNNENEEQRKRSHSTGNAVENSDLAVMQDRPSLFMDLKKELLARDSQNLKPVIVEPTKSDSESEEEEDTSLSREDLKSKLETIFAAGGPHFLRPRLMKSNPPTPEEAYQTDTSSTESIPKLPKIDKNDTLKRQKDKYGEVLNSFMLSLNKGDDV